MQFDSPLKILRLVDDVIDDIVKDFAEQLIEELKNRIPTSSGETEQSFFYRWDGKRLQVGSTKAWITVLEDGRPPGKRMPKDVIEGEFTDWVSRTISTDNPKSLAYAIATVQAEKGSLLYRAGGNSGVLSDVINLEYVSDNLTKPLKESIVSKLVELASSGKKTNLFIKR